MKAVNVALFWFACMVPLRAQSDLRADEIEADRQSKLQKLTPDRPGHSRGESHGSRKAPGSTAYWTGATDFGCASEGSPKRRDLRPASPTRAGICGTGGSRCARRFALGPSGLHGRFWRHVAAARRSEVFRGSVLGSLRLPQHAVLWRRTGVLKRRPQRLPPGEQLASGAFWIPAAARLDDGCQSTFIQVGRYIQYD